MLNRSFLLLRYLYRFGCPGYHSQTRCHSVQSQHIDNRLSILTRPGSYPALGNMLKSAVFSRMQISHRLGGSTQSMVAKGKVVNGKAKDGGPLEPFMVFYEAKWNPWAPPNPGSHGILHHSLYYPPTIPAVYHSEYPFDETLRTPTPNGAPLFVRQGPNKWEYLGHYQWHRSRPLTGAEWSSLPLQVLYRIFYGSQSN